MTTRAVSSIAWRAGLVVGAFALGALAARGLRSWRAYHARFDTEYRPGTAERGVVERVLDEDGSRVAVDVRMASGKDKGKTLRGTLTLDDLGGLGRPAVGERRLVVAERRDGGVDVQVGAPVREGFLGGMAGALLALLWLTAGRKGLATAGSAAWALVLLAAVVLPGALRGARVDLWCVPLALAIAVPTLLAIGGWNRKSAGAIGGALCGVVAGGLVSVGFAHAMALTGLEVDFGSFPHPDNLLWFAPRLSRVDFRGVLVAGMLLAGLGAVMDVSMAVASTVAEMRRAAAAPRLRGLVAGGLAAGRDIIGVMVFTLALVFVGSHLVFAVSVHSTGWADRWTQLLNYEELAAELARTAAAAVGMALCVPASALLTALLHRGPAAGAQHDAEPHPAPPPRRRGRAALVPIVAVAACLVVAGLADEWTLRTYLPERGGPEDDTVARVLAFDEPTLELSARSAEPRERGFLRSRLAVVQPSFGPRAGELLPARMLVGSSPAGNLPLRRGSLVRAAVEDANGEACARLYTLPLRYRWGLVAALAVAATLVVAGGRVGLRVLLVMAGAAALMLGVLVPTLWRGWPPLLVTGAACVAMLGAVFALSGSADRKAMAALAGCVLGLAVAACLVVVSGWWLGFRGMDSTAAQFLARVAEQTGVSYDYRGLLEATLLIVLFGLTLDTAVTVATGVAQVGAARPGAPRQVLAAAGMGISRDVVGTMVLTLVFAFVGLRLPVLLMPDAVGLSAAEMVNGEAGASELLHVLVGALALAVTGPATALVASRLMAGRAPAARATAARRRWPLVVAAALALAVCGGAVHWWTLRRARVAATAPPSLPSGRDELLAAARRALQDGKRGATLLALWKARERFPNDPRVRTELAYACHASGYAVQARRAIEAALSHGADDARTHDVAWLVFRRTGQHAQAEAHLRRAVRLDPANHTARVELAYVHMMARRIAEARREIDAALRAGADDSRAHYVAGVVCLWTRRRAEARKHLERALRLDPAHRAARAALDTLRDD